MNINNDKYNEVNEDNDELDLEMDDITKFNVPAQMKKQSLGCLKVIECTN